MDFFQELEVIAGVAGQIATEESSIAAGVDTHIDVTTYVNGHHTKIDIDVAPGSAAPPLPGGTAWLAGVVIAEQLFADASLTSGGMAASYPPFDLTIFGKATTWTVSTSPA